MMENKIEITKQSIFTDVTKTHDEMKEFTHNELAENPNMYSVSGVQKEGVLHGNEIHR